MEWSSGSTTVLLCVSTIHSPHQFSSALSFSSARFNTVSTSKSLAVDKRLHLRLDSLDDSDFASNANISMRRFSTLFKSSSPSCWRVNRFYSTLRKPQPWERLRWDVALLSFLRTLKVTSIVWISCRVTRSSDASFERSPGYFLCWFWALNERKRCQQHRVVAMAWPFWASGVWRRWLKSSLSFPIVRPCGSSNRSFDQILHPTRFISFDSVIGSFVWSPRCRSSSLVSVPRVFLDDAMRWCSIEVNLKPKKIRTGKTSGLNSSVISKPWRRTSGLEDTVDCRSMSSFVLSFFFSADYSPLKYLDTRNWSVSVRLSLNIRWNCSF